MTDIPNTYYRTSIKALVLDDQKRFLLVKEEGDVWNLPGGGLDWGEDIKTCLSREIREEMGIPVTWVADNPTYFTAFFDGQWRTNAIYLTTLEHLNFTPSPECLDLRFFSVEEAKKEKLFESTQKFLEVYKPENH